jgi:tetratricopeptide (TPR) repeat protein
VRRIYCLICIVFLAFTSCKSGRERAIEFVKEGQALEYKNDGKAAYKLFTKAINADPTFAPAWFYRGNCLANKRDLEGAVADYTKAIELKPDFADAYSNRGDIYFSQGNRNKACPDYLKAEQLGKENMYEKTKFCK